MSMIFVRDAFGYVLTPMQASYRRGSGVAALLVELASLAERRQRSDLPGWAWPADHPPH